MSGGDRRTLQVDSVQGKGPARGEVEASWGIWVRAGRWALRGQTKLCRGCGWKPPSPAGEREGPGAEREAHGLASSLGRAAPA